MIPANKVMQLASYLGIKRIEGQHGIGNTMDDLSDVNAHISPVKLGQSPLPQGYDGSGVVIGIIDDGIDITHPDFKDAGGNTRIKYLWSQTDISGGTTPSYGYGQEWDAAAINAGASYIPTTAYFGHGSIVSGIACGDPVTQHQYEGVAPKADIIFVAVDMGANFLNNMVDATEYIYTKAALLGKPCVINASVGTYNGSHDGLDLQAQAIDALFANIPGRCVVAAAGNAGNIPFHLKYDLSADTNFTFIYNAGSNQSAFYVYADTNNFKQANYTIGVCDNQTFRYVGNIGFRDITSCLGVTKSDTLRNTNGDQIGVIETTGDILGGSYEMLVNIMADSAQFYWTLENTGVGSFDSWNFDFMDSLSSVGLGVPNFAFYKAPDTSQTVCTSFQCSNEVITVANYTSRTGHISCNQVPVTMPGPYDTLVYNSSRGPTRDNRLKPDIAATGDNIMTTCQVWICNWMSINWTSPQNDIISDDTLHIKFDGTSSASPAVAGVAVLYLQKNPTATNQQVKSAITACARHDAYTGNNLPNVGWGYGKLDGFNALLCGPMSAQNAMLNHEKLNVYPNPASEQVHFIFEKEQGSYDIKIYSVLGNEIKTIKGTEKSTVLSVQNFAQGLYLYKIFQNQTLVNEGKFVKE